MADENGKTIDEWVEEFRQLIAAEQWEDILDAAEKCIVEHPDDPLGYFCKATSNIALENHERAIDDLNKVIQMKANYPDAYRNRGVAYSNIKRYEEALTDFDKAIELNRNEPENYYGRGIALVKIGRLTHAIIEFDEAIRLKSNDSRYYSKRGHAKAKSQQYQLAIEDYDSAISLESSNHEHFNSRGNAKAKLKRYDDAIFDYDAALEIKPKSANALNDRGNAKTKLERYDEAISDYDKAIKINPKKARFYYNRGNAKRLAKRFNEAINDFNEAIKISPKKGHFFFQRGKSKAKLDRLEEAVADYDEAIRLLDLEIKRNPEDQVAIRNKNNAEKAKSDVATEKERKQKKANLVQAYHSYDPEQLLLLCDLEINKIERELYGFGYAVNSSEYQTRFKQHFAKYGSLYAGFSVIPFGFALFTFFVDSPSCYEGMFHSCHIQNIFFNPWIWAILTIVITLYKWQAWFEIGLEERSRQVASNLRGIFVLVFLILSEVNFGLLGIKEEAKGSIDNALDLMRFATSAIFITAPFFFYYRHVQNRTNQLQIVLLALQREKKNLTFWVVQRDEDINSPTNQFGKQILSHMTKNAAADIGVRMLHPKLDEGRRWSWFGFGGKALSELEDKLEDLTDVIKRLELREPKQDEDKQKTKGNDTDVGATTDNK